MRILKYTLYLLIAALHSCGDGIAPGPEKSGEPGFSGTAYFEGAWPDSVARTHIVLFKDPLLSPEDFNAFNLRYVSQEIPYGVDEFYFSTRDSNVVGNIQPGEYSYLAVAQSASPSLSLNRKDWYVVGVYYRQSDTTEPGILRIPENEFIEGIEINCDYGNLPEQPPGG